MTDMWHHIEGVGMVASANVRTEGKDLLPPTRASSVTRDRGPIWVAVALCGVVALWIATPFVIPWLARQFSSEPVPASQFGDYGAFANMFGAIDTLFTGIAFVGLVYTLIMQRRELR